MLVWFSQVKKTFGDNLFVLIDDPVKRAEMGARGRSYVEAEVARDVVLQRFVELLTGKPAT